MSGTNTPRAERDFTKNAVNTLPTKTNIVERIRDTAKTGQRIKKLLITPEMAQDIMTLNSNNRPVKHVTVEDYAETMKADKWLYTSESVFAIDTDLHLMNGQHRLLAIIKSAKSQYFDIATGFDPDTYKVLDKGRNRTTGDTFALEGIKEHNKVAAVATFILAYSTMGKVTSGSRVRGISDTILVDWIRDERNKKRVVECVQTADVLYRHGRWLSPTVYAGMLFLLGGVRKTDAEEFLTRLATGEDLSSTHNSTIYCLRRILEKWDENKKKDWGKAKNNEYKVRYVITAWNYYVQKDNKGRPMEIQSLKLDRDLIEIPKIKRQ